MKPEPFFYCKYGGILPTCSNCEKNHINSQFSTEDITTWFCPDVHSKRCNSKLKIMTSKKTINTDIEQMIVDLPGVEQTEPDGTKYHLISHDDLVAFAERLSDSSEKPNNPEGLDEAAKKSAMDNAYMNEFVHECEVDDIFRSYEETFKDGVKWAFGQGVIGEVKDFCFVREVNYASAKIEFDTIPELKEGEEVIVQIRKK